MARGTRCGWAVHVNWPPRARASLAELQQAGGWRSPATPEVYIRREAAARGPVARRRYQVG